MPMETAAWPAFPADRELPELTVAADPAAMKGVFARHFSAGGASLTVEDCRICRIRYRRHIRCFVQYALTLRRTDTGESMRQWVAGTMYAQAGRAERAWRESVRVTSGGRGRPIAPAGFIRELRMAIDVFPHDRKLRHAALVAEDRDPALDAVVLAAFGAGAWAITQWAPEPARYREHLALVVRYAVRAVDTRTGVEADKTFFLKTYPDADQPRRMYAELSRLARYAKDSSLGVRIDAPLACLDHLNALVVERTAGQPLDALLGEGTDAEVTAAVRDTAQALAAFNQSDAPTGRRYTVSDHLSALDRAQRLLQCACPEFAAALASVTGAAAAQLSDVDPRPTHRDMKPEHVLLGPEGPAFIDLDSCASADPMMDAALMLARFTALAVTGGDAGRMDRARAAFAREYLARVPAAWHVRLRPYYATALVEVASGIFHRQEHAWRSCVAALVAEANAAMARSPESGGVLV
jgi:hypothetical protein